MSDESRDLLADIALRLIGDIDDISERLLREIVTELPDLAADVPIMNALAESVHENVSAVLRIFADPEHPAPTTPVAALDHARRMAQRGVPLSALLRAYRLGQASFQRQLIMEIAASGVDAQVAGASLELSSIAFTYIDRISEDVVAAYQQERESWLRTRIAVRSARVATVLSAGPVDIGEAERALGYRLLQRHLGIVVWSEDSAAGRDQHLPRLERAVTAVAGQLGCSRAPLSVAPDESTVWAWLPSPDPVADSSVGALVELDPDIRVAFGRQADGLEGFRRTHRQARQAQQVALVSDVAHRRPVTRSADIGALGMMCADVEDLASWVRTTLGELAGDGKNMAQLRETLWTFLAAGRSYTAAAQTLHLHKNTVVYRVNKAEEACGRDLTDNRLDIELALLACRTLGATVLQAPDH